MGLSQPDFARKFFIQPRTYQNIEAGKTERLEAKSLAALAASGVEIVWLVSGSRAAFPAGPGEVELLRQELSDAQTRIEALTAQLTESTRHGAKHVRWALDEQEKRQRLEAEIQILRAQATAAILGPEEGKLVVRAGELLGLTGAAGLEQVLGRVVDIFGAREAARGTPPTVHDKDTVQKLEGDGGGPEEEIAPPRANSSS